MLTNFKRQTSVLFLDSNSDVVAKFDKSEKLDIILSPSLYWVKRISLPVKSAAQASKLLSSIFEESLPQGYYSYVAYKDGDDFLVFAYEDKKILSLLDTKEIHLANIRSIHFAQQEFKSLESAVKINATQSMYLKDSLLLLAPSAWFSDAKELELNNIQLSKHTIKLQQFGHLVDKKSLYKVGAILLIFALILIAEIFVATAKKDALQRAKEDVFTKYKLQATMFQNQSIKSKYETIYKTESRLRLVISYFLKMKLQKSQKISLMEYKNRVLKVTFSGLLKGHEQRIISQLKARGVKYNISYRGDSMKVEIKI